MNISEKIVNKAFNRRTKSDYDIYVSYEKAEIDEMFMAMKEFILEIKKLLKP